MFIPERDERGERLTDSIRSARSVVDRLRVTSAQQARDCATRALALDTIERRLTAARITREGER